MIFPFFDTVVSESTVSGASHERIYLLLAHATLDALRITASHSSFTQHSQVTRAEGEK